ncbi:MAG: bifunctional serine/threonine-protein kinase/formylglycine-generating enzyme family protein [Planctomycetota bacterium]
MAKRSSKKTRRATTKRPSTKRSSPARAVKPPAKYALGREIGRGGLGRVVEAVDAEIGRTVALKLLLDGAPLDLVERFKREGRITGRLEHPNIVPVHEVGHLPGEKGSRGEIFFAMKKIAGRDLADVLKEFRAGKGGWTLRRLEEIFRDVCRAMAFAHSKGVIHRDLKPSNVMVGEFGEVLVVDWGLAREGRESKVEGRRSARPDSAERPLLTLDGDIFGTPDYMSPEQADGRTELVDERSDVFSLGAVLYEILAGRPPFAGGSTTEILKRVIEGNPTRPTDLLKTFDPAGRSASSSTVQPLPVSLTIPPELEEICLKALAKERKDRYPNAEALAGEMQRFLDGALERERRERFAEEEVARARAAIARWRGLEANAREAAERASALSREVRQWQPQEKKIPLWDAEDAEERLAAESIGAFSEADSALASAMSNVPHHKEARRLKAGLYWERFLEAERAGRARDAMYFRPLVEHYNDGDLDAALRGDGTLEVRTAAWPCACLSEGRSVAASDMNVLGYHPWSGRRLDGAEPEFLKGAEDDCESRLRVHAASCATTALAGARAWAYLFKEERRLLVPTTPAGATGPAPPAELLDALFAGSPFRPRGPGLFLGETPVAPRSWPMGSWLLLLEAPGRSPARVPFVVRRQEQVSLDVVLYRPEETPDDFRAVAAGAFTYQGDASAVGARPGERRDLGDVFIARDPVTCAQYAEFVTDLFARDPAQATARTPRASDKSGFYWPIVHGRCVVPTTAWLAAASPADRARAARLESAPGDWEERWPVFGVSWEDAMAFARWRSLRDGRLYTIPHEVQWEKSGRGPDARPYPWGRRFDGLLCNVQESHEGTARPSTVEVFATDESPYGVRGLAGNQQEWCLNEPGPSYRGWRSTRGSTWAGSAARTRLAYRAGNIVRTLSYSSGFRLAAVVKLTAAGEGVCAS